MLNFGTYLSDGRGLRDELNCCSADWMNIELGGVSRRPGIYKSLFPRAGRYGVRSIGTGTIKTESGGSFEVETIEVASESEGGGKLMMVSGRPKAAALDEIRKRYQDAVVVRHS
jgi:hypothetical protein